MSVGATAEVKSKLSVVDVVGETVTLKKAGTTYKGLCPFHGEKTPSFVVTPARETWHCFGCGLGGDIFSFVMQRDGATFPEALRILAGKAGVEIDERTKREDMRRARLRSVLDTTIAFYHAVLTGSKAGEPALAYLQGRGFTDATIETYQLGWAPGGWDLMARQLQAKRDIRAEELVEVGLASPSQRGRGVIDKFRARVIFPIRDANGNAVGLGGRLLEGEGAQVPQLPGDAAVRQEPDALPHRQGEGPHPTRRPGRHRRGLYRRADGPPGRLRERRGQPRDGADAEPDRAPDPIRRSGSRWRTTSTRPARRPARSA